MFLGMLIGLALWGLFIGARTNHSMDAATKHALESVHPHVLATIRIKNLYRLISLIAFLIGTCGAVGWCIEVILQ